MIKIQGPKLNIPTNAVLTFTVDTGTQQTDPDTGNVSTIKTTVELNASLTELGDKTSDTDQPGLDTRFRNMRGYIMGAIPTGVILNGRVPCIISSQSGTFHFTERLTPFISDIKKILGTPIQGSFQSEGGGN